MAQSWREPQPPPERRPPSTPTNTTSPHTCDITDSHVHVQTTSQSATHELTISQDDFATSHYDGGLEREEKHSLLASPPVQDPPISARVATTNDDVPAQGSSHNATITPTWMNMPNKGQLAILAASRFVDFFQVAALQTYMVFQLKSFDPALSESTIAHQAGVLQGAFPAAQIITSILWGRAADRPSFGRKMVLNIGLIGTGIGCVGVGFSKSYKQAVFWRFLSGAINGTVGSARTMVAEKTPKPWHPRAFVLLPAAFNVANVLGPILSGMLVDPYMRFPQLFGQDSLFGGSEGLGWMRNYPYAMPNLLSTVLLFSEALLVHFFLTETLKTSSDMSCYKQRLGHFLRRLYRFMVEPRHRERQAVYDMQRHGLLHTGQQPSSIAMKSINAHNPEPGRGQDERLPFRRIWTSNVFWTLLSLAVFDFHMGAFASLWILFLATPRTDEAKSPNIFKFSSGLAFPPQTIGWAMSIIGFIGVALQFLLYPWANSRFGLMRCFRGALFLFPMAYALAPFIALVPSSSSPPWASAGFGVWISIAFVLFLQVAARTFALPASIILLNNASPHPSVLATIHGVGQACSAMFRTLGPMLAGYWYGAWTEQGYVGMSWWIVAGIALLGCVASYWVRNGSGREIILHSEESDLRQEHSQHRPRI